tara:strand:- start:397 stop:1011 length:615 start_codon:yes stop_codon:yes gene_type:complete
MNIRLIRHCETDWNKLEKCQGISDIELNETGLKQSRFLKKYFLNKEIDIIFSSDLKRAIKTSEIINENLNCTIVKSKELREMDQGDFEGLTFKFIRSNHKNELDKWRENPRGFRIPNGETLGEAQKRAIDYINQIVINYNKMKNIVIVSHNLVISSVLCYYLNKDLVDFGKFTIDSGSISKLKLEKSKINVEEINFTDHLNNHD